MSVCQTFSLGYVVVERAVAHVDLGAIERNCAHIGSQLTNGAMLCAVVKADGYGHGDVMAAKAALAGGAEWLFPAPARGGGGGGGARAAPPPRRVGGPPPPPGRPAPPGPR